MLLEVCGESMKVLARTPPRFILFCLLMAYTDTYRIPLDLRVCSASPVPVICLECSALVRPTTRFVH